MLPAVPILPRTGTLGVLGDAGMEGRRGSMLDEAESWRPLDAIRRKLVEGVSCVRLWAGKKTSTSGASADRAF